ncbi:hypothetical protein HDU81_007759 [Chytriomyces hyalinus]|nr:hypothetical protein HDU81_007759 [Chytriomyces hyalinus]
MFKITKNETRPLLRQDHLQMPEWEEIIQTRLVQAETARQQAETARLLQERAEQLDKQQQEIETKMQQLREVFAHQKDVHRYQAATSLKQSRTAAVQKYRRVRLKKKTAGLPTLTSACPSTCVMPKEVIFNQYLHTLKAFMLTSHISSQVLESEENSSMGTLNNPRDVDSIEPVLTFSLTKKGMPLVFGKMDELSEANI